MFEPRDFRRRGQLRDTGAIGRKVRVGQSALPFVAGRAVKECRRPHKRAVIDTVESLPDGLFHGAKGGRLGDSRYQRELAEAIGDAILTYRAENGLIEAQGDAEAGTGDTGSGGR